MRSDFRIARVGTTLLLCYITRSGVALIKHQRESSSSNLNEVLMYNIYYTIFRLGVETSPERTDE